MKTNLMEQVKELMRRQSEHVLRCVTVRTNDGTNQCQPANAWMKIINRIANRRTDETLTPLAWARISNAMTKYKEIWD
jgi:paraquat-inducible protein B